MSVEMPGSVASFHYFDRDLGRLAVKLLPSEYYVTMRDTALLTVLGSCVAACLHDPFARVAGMNHFMLPDEGDSGRADASAMRYGAHAMDVLVSELVKAGARRERLRAKVFGGAAVLPNMPSLNIGDRNADFVVRYLRAAQIDLCAQDLGGAHARRICFLPESGKVVVRKLRATPDVNQIHSRESELLRTLWAGASHLGLA
jgi:chemotaxis protein CheD